MCTDWENSLRVDLWRRSWESWWMNSWVWASSVCLQPGRPTTSWASSTEGWQRGRERLSHSTLLLWGHIWSTAFRSGAPVQERWGSIGVGPMILWNINPSLSSVMNAQLTYPALTDPTERVSPVVLPYSTLQPESQLFLFLFFYMFFFLDSSSSHSNISKPLLGQVPYRQNDLQLNIVIMVWQYSLWRCRCWHLIAWFQMRPTWFTDMISAQDNGLNSSERSYLQIFLSNWSDL